MSVAMFMERKDFNTLSPVFRMLIPVLLCTLSWAQPVLTRTTPTGVKMPIAPQTAEYRLVQAFPGVTFENPVRIVGIPGETNRLFVVERGGKIIGIPNLQNPSKEVFLDISGRVNADYMNLQTGAEGVTSLAFHPRYPENGLFFLTYTHRSPSGNLNRLSRFTRGSNGLGDPSSEQVMIEQLDEGYGHNFNDLHFGPDGHLYLAVGDEGDGGGSGDEFDNSQRIDKDFFSGILRLDVDNRSGSLQPNPHPASKGGYKIPADNPFVGATQFNGAAVDPAKVRTEFYAVGFRNPWRMAFDSQTGALYAGDVGRKGAEEINLVQKGSNHGWAFREGASRTGRLGNPPEGVQVVAPILEYPQAYTDFGGMCVIGGEVYRGTRMPELHGAYIFGDWMTGNIWSLRHNGSTATEWKKIAGLYFISAFGVDPRNGDILICYDKLEETAEVIYRLEYNQTNQGNSIPATLAETGLFSDLNTLTPVAGFVPYDVNVPLWSDGAQKWRWFGMLDSTAKVDFSPSGNWTFPSGSIWIKHFELELEQGNPSSRKRLETRVLVKNTTQQGIYGVTYRWDNAHQNANLVPADGATAPFIVQTGSVNKMVQWRFPSRSECLACHQPNAGYALGFNAAQLNRSFHYPGGENNQIAALRDAGYLSSAPDNVHSIKRLAALHEEEWSREYRARSYLAVNCANCHQPGGVERARWDGRITTPLSQAGIIHGELVDQFGHDENRVVKPGDPSRSVLLQRMKTAGPGHMPPLAVSLNDEQAIALLEQWIGADLQNYATFEEWIVGKPVGLKNGKNDDPDEDGASNWMEYLLSSDPSQPGDALRVAISADENGGTLKFERAANRWFEVLQSGDLTGGGWSPLESAENRPFFSSRKEPAAIAFPIRPGQNGYFRLRVHEP